MSKFKESIKSVLIQKVGTDINLNELVEQINEIADECFVPDYICDSCNEQFELNHMYVDCDSEIERVLG